MSCAFTKSFVPCVPLRFFCLPLIFTLVAASISLFVTANFHVFVLTKFLSFLGFINFPTRGDPPLKKVRLLEIRNLIIVSRDSICPSFETSASSLKSLLSGSVGFAYQFYLQLNLPEWSILISAAFIRGENELGNLTFC